MRVLVCGSRSWSDIEAIKARLATLPPGTVIVHGCARGADSIAGTLANDLGLTVERFPAAWNVYGKRAGILRNRQMLDTSPDLVLAFSNGITRGTMDTVHEARRREIPVEVIPT